MNKRKLMMGLLSGVTLAAALTVVLWPSQAVAGGGECELWETHFASGGPATCPMAKAQCRAELDDRLDHACISIFTTGEVCGVGSISYSSCTGSPGSKVVDCQRDIYCVTTSPF